MRSEFERGLSSNVNANQGVVWAMSMWIIGVLNGCVWDCCSRGVKKKKVKP